MGDRFGRRRVFQTGLVVFTTGSLLCSLATSVTALVAFRALQALGGSMLNPVALSIVSNTFTERRARARAMGIWAAVFGLSLALGPVLGGFLVSAVSWRAIFWINIPIGIAAIVLTQVFVPESRAATARRFDPWGQLLVIALLATLTYGVIEGPVRGWASPVIVSMFAAAAVSLLALVLVESRRRQPLLEVRFFRSLPFSGASVIAVLAFAVLAGFLFLNTLYLQDGRGYSALHAGLMTLPMAVMICLFAPVSGRLVGTSGAAPAAGGRRAHHDGGRRAAAPAERQHPRGLPARRVRAVRDRLRAGERADRQHRHLWHAEQPGGRGRVGRLGEQADRLRARRGDHRVAGGRRVRRPGFASASHAAWALLAACGLAVAVVGYASTGRRVLATADRVREMLAVDAPDRRSRARPAARRRTAIRTGPPTEPRARARTLARTGTPLSNG